MKKKLNLNIEYSLIKKAKLYATQHNSSVSKLVETYFAQLENNTGRKTILDVMAELPKSGKKFPKDFDFKEEYYKARANKYGF